MPGNNNSFKFYSNFLDAIDQLDESERAQACYEFCKYGITGELPKEKALAMFCIGVSVSVQKYQGCGGNHNPTGKNQYSEKEVKSGQVGQVGQVKQTETKTETRTETKTETEELLMRNFDEFWNYYTPVKSNDGHFVAKGNKKSCKEKFVKLINKGENYENIIRGLEQYLKYCQENGICSCGAEVFLNQRRWENDYSSNGTVQSNVPGRLHRQHPDIVETARQFAEMP